MTNTDPMEKKEIGAIGEGLTAKYLEQHGYTVLERNFHGPHGEIDVIAKNDRYLVFCEVKTRKSFPSPGPYGRPARAVNVAKRKHLLDTARYYMKKTFGTDAPEGLQPRMDVSEILYEQNGEQTTYRIRYITRAFGANGGGGQENGWEMEE